MASDTDASTTSSQLPSELRPQINAILRKLETEAGINNMFPTLVNRRSRGVDLEKATKELYTLVMRSWELISRYVTEIEIAESRYNELKGSAGSNYIDTDSLTKFREASTDEYRVLVEQGVSSVLKKMTASEYLSPEGLFDDCMVIKGHFKEYAAKKVVRDQWTWLKVDKSLRK